MTTSNNIGGSTFDVATLVSQLMQVERQPLTALQRREDALKAQLASWEKLKSGVSGFGEKVGALAQPATFAVFTGSLSDPSVAALTTTDTATAATYSLEVSQLAASQKLASAAFASASASVGSGTITVDFGRYDAIGTTFTPNGDKEPLVLVIAPGEDSLEQVKRAINGASKGVAASIVNDGTGARLVLTSTDSGEAHSLRIAVSDADGNDADTNGLSRLAYEPTAAAGAGRNLAQVVAAADARLKIDGIDIVSSSNQISSAIEGLTLSLAKVTTEPVTLAVGRDYTRLMDDVDAFVGAYNDLARQLRELTFYDQATRTKGKLQGDATVIAIQNRIRTALRGVSDDADSQYRRLADVGVSFQADATLKLDRTRLEAALKSDPEGVIALFVGADQNPTSTARSTAGVAGLLATLTGEALGSEGVFAKRAESIDRGVARIDQEQERLERRLEMIEKRYLQQYSSLDRMLAGFSSISTYLAYL